MVLGLTRGVRRLVSISSQGNGPMVADSFGSVCELMKRLPISTPIEVSCEDKTERRHVEGLFVRAGRDGNRSRLEDQRQVKALVRSVIREPKAEFND